MATLYSPKIVMDGLVLALDVGNPKSYISGSTILTDLSRRGYSGSLVNGPTYSTESNGSIAFDGVNEYVDVTGSIVTGNATFIAWLKRNGTQTNYAGIIFSRGTSVTGFNFALSNQLGYHWNDAANTSGWTSNVTVPDAAWCMCAISVATSSATVYLCQASGITFAVNNVSHASTTINSIKIGWDTAASLNRYFKVSLGSASIYNRALSAQEILQNFNATKRRFGI